MRSIARAVLLSVLIILIAFVAFSYLSGTAYWRYPRANPSSGSVGTTGTGSVEKARQAGAAVGEKVGVAAAKVGQAVDDATLTTTIKARAIDSTTNESVVTLTGTVGSQAEHDRAVALARETEGVTKVVDRLVI